MPYKRILVVDSEAEVPALLAAAPPHAEAYEIRTASDMGEALADIRDHPPHLIIVNERMLQAGGPGTLGALREVTPGAVPILVLGSGPQQTAAEYMRLGASDYLRKPLAAQALQGAIRKALAAQDEPQDLMRHMPRLVDLVQHAAEAIIAVDTRGRLLFCNKTARELFEIANDAPLADQPLPEVIHAPEVIELFSAEPRSEHGQRMEITLHHGTLILNAQLTIVENVGRVVIMQDITPLKALDHIKTEFVQKVSQGIRSPLTTILGYVELLDRAGPINEQQRAFIERINFSVHSITALLSELLELSRVEAGLDLEREPTQLPFIVRYAVEGRRQQFEARQQTIQLSMPERTSRPILGNPTHLRQVVDNLLDNASKCTPPGGVIGVSLAEEADFVVLRISDNGIGIPAEDQPHVFERFYRARNAAKRYEGAGLGLALVKSIVEGHGGRIWLESQENKGTTFTIMLPAQDNHSEALRRWAADQVSFRRSAY